MSTPKVKNFKNNYKADICRKIRELAEQKGMTRAELSRRTGISYRIIHKVFAGEAALRDGTINRIARALGEEFSAIVGTPPAMVKEEPAEYSALIVNKPPSRSVCLIDAINALAEQLRVPPKVVVDKFSELLNEKINQGGTHENP